MELCGARQGCGPEAAHPAFVGVPLTVLGQRPVTDLAAMMSDGVHGLGAVREETFGQPMSGTPVDENGPISRRPVRMTGRRHPDT